MSGAIQNIFTNELRVNKIFLILIVVLLLMPLHPAKSQMGGSPYQLLHGAIVRGDTSKTELALVFTGDSFADGGIHIARILSEHDVKGSFFFTGKFYRNPEFENLIQALVEGEHYLGAHSDQHLLYCTWENRDSLLVSKEQFNVDLSDNYSAMRAFGIAREDALFFLPPYEWYNDSIAGWTRTMEFQLINNTHGTLSHADYTVPGSSGYRSSEEIFRSILEYETSASDGLNGFILLTHTGTAPERTDKFYLYLEKLIVELKEQGYRFKRIDELLNQSI